MTIEQAAVALCSVQEQMTAARNRKAELNRLHRRDGDLPCTPNYQPCDVCAEFFRTTKWDVLVKRKQSAMRSLRCAVAAMAKGAQRGH